MSFSRLLSWGIVPVMALLSLPILAPHVYQSLYSYATNSNQLFDLPTPIIPRSETPLIFSSVSHFSHFEKNAAIAVELAALGYPITFFTGRVYEDNVRKLHPNIKYSPWPGTPGMMSPEDMKTWLSMPSGPAQEIFSLNAVVIDPMPLQHEALQAEFRNMRKEYGNSKPIITLTDQISLGIVPVSRGAAGIRPDTTIGISLAPVCLQSNDTFPFPSGKQPLKGPDARAKHWDAYMAQIAEEPNLSLTTKLENKLRGMNVKDHKTAGFMQAFNTEYDILLTLGIPEFEFPRSDVKIDLRWYGAFEKVGRPDGEVSLPSWWDDIAKAKKEGKKIIAASQGTVSPHLNEIVLPTLEAMKERDDVLVIASTVMVDPKDVPDLVVPDNARVEKFIPYDRLLPLVDILVSNGGYGAVQHALRLGIPMVVSGRGQDKATTNAIVQYTGVGLDLEVQAPGAKKIGEAIDKLIKDGSFKKKAVELSKHYKKYNIGRVFDKAVQDAVRKWKAKKEKPVVGEL